MNAFFRELLRTGIYKRSQGRICRQITFAALATVIALGLYSFSQTLVSWGQGWEYGLCVSLLLMGWWATYRLVNMPAFADFLIAVEAEMNKVSWPSRRELIRGSSVVIITIVVLAVLLYAFDAIWRIIFETLGIL